MFKLEFTKSEVEEIKSKIYLSELQERIFEYRLKEYSITKMAMLENVSESTINRELRKVKRKIMKVIWHFLEREKTIPSLFFVGKCNQERRN